MKDLKIKRPSFFITDTRQNKTIEKFVIKPLDRGYGDTLGTALRRTLLASIPGAAITCVRIDNATHEFVTLEGVFEDVPRIVLNLKKILIRVDSEDDNYEQILTLNEYGPKDVLASDFSKVNGLEIINPDLHIATLASGAKLSMEVVVNRGSGFNLDEFNRRHLTVGNYKREAGYFAIDSIFAPVIRVSYTVERLMEDEEELQLEVETNGTVEPKEALANAAKILAEYFESIVAISEKASLRTYIVDDQPVEEPIANAVLGKQINEYLDLKNKASNCLHKAAIFTVGELVLLTENEVRKIPGIGEGLLKEIKKELENKGLALALVSSARPSLVEVSKKDHVVEQFVDETEYEDVDELDDSEDDNLKEDE